MVVRETHYVTWQIIEAHSIIDPWQAEEYHITGELTLRGFLQGSCISHKE